MSLSALDDDIHLGKVGNYSVPHDRDKLIKWVKNPEHLDLVTESFRRVCSGYVSTGRLFSICAGPYYLDWPAVLSMLKTAYSTLYGAYNFVDIGGHGKLSEEAEKLDKALDLIKEVEESISLARMCASLPSPAERIGEGAEQ